jgi:chaperonin GroEL
VAVAAAGGTGDGAGDAAGAEAPRAPHLAMGKRVLFDDAARRAIGRGVAQLARAVRVTLGPRGRTVLVEHAHERPALTSDGAAVAREIELADPFENLGVRLVREAAERTAREAGDGSSTMIVLADALIAGGLERLAAGASPQRLRRGMERAVLAVLAHVRSQARPLASHDERVAVAAIAARGDAGVGELVAQALEAVGAAGGVSVEDGRTAETRLTVRPGLGFERGWSSPYFVNDPETMRVLLASPRLLVSAQRLDAAADVAAALSAALAAGAPLLVLAEEVTGEALALLVVNQLRGVAQACAVPAPFAGAKGRAWLAEVATRAGATLFGDERGLAAAAATDDDLGRLAEAVIERGRALLVFPAGDQGRGGVATLEIGGATEPAARARRGHVEDAVSALRSAVAEGVVPGGGVALVRARHAALAAPLEGDAKLGALLVADALMAPARWIAANAGADPELVAARLLGGSGANGFDASLGQFVDLERAGVLDPARVVRTALTEAAAVAGLLLTTDALVVTDDDAEPTRGSG